MRRAHCSQRHSPTHRATGRRHAHRPAFRPREPLRAGAARRAHLDDVLNIFQESHPGTLKFPCHFLTLTHARPSATTPIPAPSHPSHARAQAACTHPRAGRMHHVNPLRVPALRFAACSATAACNVPPQGVTPALAVTPSSEETTFQRDITLPIIGSIILAISARTSYKNCL